MVAVSDVITCAEFGTEISRGYDFKGDQIFGFPIDSFTGPYNSAALMHCAPCDYFLVF